MRRMQYDAIVIGGGAAGMAAARELHLAGCRVALVERDEFLGGILMQCIHNGFGLRRFKQELTGPEYAEKYRELIADADIDIFLNTTVMDIHDNHATRSVTAYSAAHGVLCLEACAVVLAMGCRERNRGNLGIPGTRPAGVFTAGLAQRLLNIDGYVPGRRAVIVGSGDIGLIMARRLSWVGCEVAGVIEIMPFPSGLTRNIVQCLDDFNIPLYLGHVVTRINGRDRVESVDVSPLENGTPADKDGFNLKCDTVLLSVGLVPENELSRKTGIEMCLDTNGPRVDAGLMTSVSGIFACGNVLHVHDLVDFVTEEAERCGREAAKYIGANRRAWGNGQIRVRAGANIRYVTPAFCAADTDNHFFMRSMVVADRAELLVIRGRDILARKKLRHVKPAEMLELNLDQNTTAGLQSSDEALEISLTTEQAKS